MELKSLAFLTAAEYPELSADCKLGAEAVRKRGVNVTPVIWDQTDVSDLKRYDAVVIRSIWDYQRKLPKFLKWLDELDQNGIKTLNPTQLMRWNLSKRYLSELSREHDLPIIPTHWIEKDQRDFEAVLEQCPWKKLVVKPEISASADLTFVFAREQEKELHAAIREIQSRAAVMVQPFCESILTGGETSLVYFFDGDSHQLSHVVCKRPRAGDFRIQHEHGGIYERIEPPRGLIALGERAISSLGQDWLYGRVDVVSFEGQLCIGELELMEPQLYFRWAPEMAEAFADALLARLERRR